MATYARQMQDLVRRFQDAHDGVTFQVEESTIDPRIRKPAFTAVTAYRDAMQPSRGSFETPSACMTAESFFGSVIVSVTSIPAESSIFRALAALRSNDFVGVSMPSSRLKKPANL